MNIAQGLLIIAILSTTTVGAQTLDMEQMNKQTCDKVFYQDGLNAAKGLDSKDPALLRQAFDKTADAAVTLRFCADKMAMIDHDPVLAYTYANGSEMLRDWWDDAHERLYNEYVKAAQQYQQELEARVKYLEAQLRVASPTVVIRQEPARPEKIVCTSLRAGNLVTTDCH